MTAIYGNPPPCSPPAHATRAPDTAPPRLYEICGLLTVQEDLAPSEREKAQFEDALRVVNSTEIGAALLRDIKACDIPPEKRPVCIFHEQDPYYSDASASEYAEPDGAPIINFYTLPPGTEGDDQANAHRLIDLFGELVKYYATNIGISCSMLGFEPYRMSTFREQIGVPMDQWKLDMESYLMEAYTEEAVDSAETHDDAIRIIMAWVRAENPQAVLRLTGLGLSRCPPLGNVPGLTAVDLSGNLLTAFPPADRLPATVQTVDLAGNPVRDGAERYSPSLRQVTLGGNDCDIERLISVLPRQVQVLELDAAAIERIEKYHQLITDFPEVQHGRIPVEAMRRAGWTDAMAVKAYAEDMLKNAVKDWLAPGPVNDSWRRAQQEQPIAAFAMAVMLGRLQGVSQTIGDAGFRRRLVALLDKMQQKGNEQLQAECLRIAEYGAESCNDLLLDTVNSLNIAAQKADAIAGVYDKRLVELMKMGERMLALHTATRFIAELMPELHRRAKEQTLARSVEPPDAGMDADEDVHAEVKADEVEQFLVLQARLNGTAPLPPMQFNMEFGALSLLTDADIAEAGRRIRDEIDTGLVRFLGMWEPLQSVIQRTAPALRARAEKLQEHIYHDRGRLYGVLDRLPDATRSLFVHDDPRSMMVFQVRDRRFWTRYDRLVDRFLTAHGLNRDDDHALVQACRVVSDDIQAMIHGETVRQFMAMNKLHLGSWIKPPEQPQWFKRLLKRI